MKMALTSVHITAIREPQNSFRIDGKQPDGLTLTAWKKGRSLVWDYTCRDTMAPNNIAKNGQEAVSSSTQAEKKKYPTMRSFLTNTVDD